ncbi:MAG: serine/threonine protein kinase [Myxococcales bacterium]|nr:serine/threonine protein kinase [Myxococcales bacterium]
MHDPGATATTEERSSRDGDGDGDPTGRSRRVDGELLSAGARIGRYQIDAHVGAGGHGRIYAAHDPELDRRVALKVLRAERDDEVGRERLLREARALAKLSHPNVVAVHDVGVDGERVFVAMEFVAGTSLRQALAERRPPWREVLELLLPAARGIAAIHAAGLVHRDLKPDNIMIGDDGRVRVVDLGLARAPRRPPVDDPAATPASAADGATLTATGVRAGTPAYMAPELWRGEAGDARSDLFAFCVTLWEALLGARPFAGRSPAELVMALASRAPTAPAGAPELPSWLHRALARGLAFEPGDRYPSMDALIDALTRGLRRARGRWTVAAIGVALAAGAGILSASGGEAPGAPLIAAEARRCLASEVCAKGPLKVPVCSQRDGDLKANQPCEPNAAENTCPSGQACAPVSNLEGVSGLCAPICDVVDDRPECAPGCYNQHCIGKHDLCDREHGSCEPVPCTTDAECEAVAACDFPDKGPHNFRCSPEARVCERVSLAPAPVACGADEVCAQGPFDVPTCTLRDGEPASEGKPCRPGTRGACPRRESCVAVDPRNATVGQCMPVCEVVDDRPECAPGCFNQQCSGKYNLCGSATGICRPVPCTSDEECAALSACDFPDKGSAGFRCAIEAGYCERAPA